MRFRLVGFLSIPMLYLKDPLMGDDTIYPELLLAARVGRWNKLIGCWQHTDKKNSVMN